MKFIKLLYFSAAITIMLNSCTEGDATQASNPNANLPPNVITGKNLSDYLKTEFIISSKDQETGSSKIFYKTLIAFEFVKESKAYDAEGVIAEVSPDGQVVQLEDVRLADYMYDHMVAAAPNCAMIYVKMYAKASIIDVTESMGYKLQFVVTKVYLPDGKIVYFPIKKSSN